MKGIRFGGRKSGEKNSTSPDEGSLSNLSSYMPFDAWVDDYESSRSLKRTEARKDIISRDDDWVEEKESSQLSKKTEASGEYISFDDWVEEYESSRSLKASSRENGDNSPKKKKKKWRVKNSNKTTSDSSWGSQAGRHISHFVESIIPSKQNTDETESDLPTTPSMVSPWDSEPEFSDNRDTASRTSSTPSTTSPWDSSPSSTSGTEHSGSWSRLPRLVGKVKLSGLTDELMKSPWFGGQA